MAETIRRYACDGVIYAKERWSDADCMLAKRLLNEVEVIARKQRVEEGLRRQSDVWPWPDAKKPPCGCGADFSCCSGA